MTRTGKYFFLFLLAFCIASSYDATAQSLSINSRLDKTQIFPGERVLFYLSISGPKATSVPQPPLPAIEGFRWLSNNVQSQEEYRLRGGQPMVIKTYIYTLIAESAGSYTFPSIQVPFDGETYSTSAIPVRIINREDLPASDPNRFPDIFLELEVDDETPVSGQQIIASVVLYYKESIEVATFQDVPGWKAEGFWKEDLDQSRNGSARATTTLREGVRFRSAVLTKYALFPTKSGELTLSPYEVSVQVRTPGRGSIFDSFSISNRRRVNVVSEPLTIDVRDVPDISDAVFSGAVGDFDVTRTLQPTTTIVGESIEVVTTISGSGGIPLISKPVYEYPGGLEQYDPQESSNINRRSDRIEGTKKFSDIIIARNPGDYEIPAVTMAFFNPVTNRFEKKNLPAIPFTVERDPNAITNAISEMELAIEPITGLAAWTTPQKQSLTSSPFIWLSLSFPLLLLIGGYMFSSYKDKMSTDTTFARSQKAFQKAQNTLSKAAEMDVKDGYNHIHKALTSFISDKCGLAEGGVSDQDYIDHLKSVNVPNEVVQELKLLLNKCSTINYAPDANSDTLNSDLDKATGLLQNLKKVL